MPCLTILTDDEFKGYCRKKGLDENEIVLAEAIIRDGYKGQDLYDRFYERWSPTTIKNNRKVIFAKLGIKKY